LAPWFEPIWSPEQNAPAPVEVPVVSALRTSATVVAGSWPGRRPGPQFVPTLLRNSGLPQLFVETVLCGCVPAFGFSGVVPDEPPRAFGEEVYVVGIRPRAMMSYRLTGTTS
jgi:hypothetical protein